MWRWEGGGGGGGGIVPDSILGDELELGDFLHHRGAQLHKGAGCGTRGVLHHQRPPPCTTTCANQGSGTEYRFRVQQPMTWDWIDGKFT